VETVRFAWEGRTLFNAASTAEEKNFFAEKCVDKFESLEGNITTEYNTLQVSC